MRYFLDTSVLVAMLRGKVKTIKYLESLEGEIVSSYICLSELYEGINRSQDKQQAEKDVESLFQRFNIVYGIDADIARIFGETRVCLKIKGEVIEDIDIFLAATCLVHNLQLITLNAKHFSRIPSLKIITPQF